MPWAQIMVQFICAIGKRHIQSVFTKRYKSHVTLPQKMASS